MLEKITDNLANLSDFHEYMIDTMQRGILYSDIIRKRGNIYLEHLKKGQPPVLVFDYELIIDGRTLEKPVNYSLVRITDRRKKTQDGKKEKRVSKTKDRFPKRPIIIIDPRAGHGPGIGGSKEDSEIGLALDYGHPVYFIMFFTSPVHGQTIGDIQKAEIAFVEKVQSLHPDADKPAIIGNCQAGWAAALVAADRPDICGPLVLNGSPLSYWGGVEGSNPMRYKGGLLGGVWVNSLLSDLGNGVFDGANLVMNMENLNPANTFWSKYYHVYENVDTEEERFLEFEKWWGGFFMLTKDEIHFIVDSLFVGNRLERGKLRLDDENNEVDIKNITDPIIVFASGGDNITPPQQALNWIAKVYKNTDEIKKNNQVIIYLVHEDIGHLGIFVSTKVANREHKEILGTVDMISYLSPGLYEMVIEEDDTTAENWEDHFKVGFRSREIEDILKLDDGFDDEAGFLPVSTVSSSMDKFYNAYLSPFVSMFSNEMSAEVLKQLHPLRTQRYLFSDLNPFAIPYKTWAKYVKKYRKQAPKDNFYRKMEKNISHAVVHAFDLYRDTRDLSQEVFFKQIYGNPLVQFFYKDYFEENIWKEAEEIVEKGPDAVDSRLRSKMDKGGFPEGVLRIIIAIASADEIIDKSEFAAVQSIIRNHPKLSRLKPVQLRKIAIEQSRLLHLDREKALKTLPKLIHYKKDRREALEIAEKIALSDSVIHEKEEKIIKRIESIMKI
jgi:poly(3-hydroxyalkanoate) synthetase/tellurite resistance protein